MIDNTGPQLLLLTGNPGTEDIIAEEAMEELYALDIVEVRKGHGRIVASVPSVMVSRVQSMRSIHSASLLLAFTNGIPPTADGLEIVRRLVYESRAYEYIPLYGTFAVRSTRVGEHEYTSMDLARIAGDAIIQSTKEKRGFTPEVQLSAPSVSYTLDLIEDKLYFGISLSGDYSLHRRGLRVYDHPAALKPTLAYTMLRIAGARDGDIIVDPMCGGGTVAIEAAYLFPTSPIICIDKNSSHIQGARLNALIARVHNRIRFIVGDARRLDAILGEASVDIIVSNPPYGIRLGSPYSVRALYTAFTKAMYRTLKAGGRATLITTEANHLIREAKTLGLRVTHIRKVRHGDLWASVIVLEKP